MWFAKDDSLIYILPPTSHYNVSFVEDKKMVLMRYCDFLGASNFSDPVKYDNFVAVTPNDSSFEQLRFTKRSRTGAGIHYSVFSSRRISS